VNVVNRAKYETHLLQNLLEFEEFRTLMRKEGVKRYLEIGSKNGGSLWRMAQKLDKGSRLVSVDLPHGDTSFKVTLPNLQQCVDRLNREGYDAHLIVGDSTDPEVVEKVRALGPFDVVFIDGNHTLPFITKDWENYGPMARMVAFHDIGYYRDVTDSKKLPIDAPAFWKELKVKVEAEGKRTREFRYEKERRNGTNRECDNGIGLLWQS